VGRVEGTGEKVFAPVKGEAHKDLLKLKAQAGVCAKCKRTLTRRDGLVDFWGNVYCSNHFPYDEVRERLASELREKLPEHEKLPELPEHEEELED
jgi:hypothetical protein